MLAPFFWGINQTGGLRGQRGVQALENIPGERVAGAEELPLNGGNWLSHRSQRLCWLCSLFQQPVLVVSEPVRVLACSNWSGGRRGSQEQDPAGKPPAWLDLSSIYHPLNLLGVVCSSMGHTVKFYYEAPHASQPFSLQVVTAMPT